MPPLGQAFRQIREYFVRINGFIAVVGTGTMYQNHRREERLANGNLAVALIANTGATVAVLAALIALLGPVSGAHFNPAVSLAQALRRVLTWREAGAYILIQIVGCCLGALLAHAMFDLPLIQSSLHARTGLPQKYKRCGVSIHPRGPSRSAGSQIPRDKAPCKENRPIGRR